jgi:hypothetical protein
VRGLRSPWIDVVAAVVGGLVFGIGIGQLVFGFTVGAAAWTVIGVIILWWSLSDRRRFRRGTPESEADGSHTVE